MILISKSFYIFVRFCYKLAVLFWFIHVALCLILDSYL